MSGRATRGPRAEDVLGRVTLVTGKEELLNERTVVAVRDAVRRHDAEAEISETAGRRADPGRARRDVGAVAVLEHPLRRGPSRWRTFPTSRSTGCSTTPPPRPTRSRWCSCTAVGPKGSGVLAKLRKLPAVTEVKSEELRASDFPGFVTEEVRHHGATIDKDAATFLVSAVGQDLRSLAAAADQLTNDFPDEALTVEKVRKYFGGRAEAKSFAVADAAFWGRRRVALEELRWAIDGGTAPVLVTSAFAGSARGRGALQGRVARDAGGRPGPRGRGAPVEAAHDPRPVAGLVRPGASPSRSAPWPRPTPTSRARPATRRTPSSGWC